MDQYKLKPGKFGERVIGAYKKVEDTVVGSYQKVENTVVEGYKKVENAFVDTFLEKVPPAEGSGKEPVGNEGLAEDVGRALSQDDAGNP